MTKKVPLKKHLCALIEAERCLRDALREADQKAIETALERSKEMLAQHNDLIRKGERDAALYITRGQVYAAVATALVVVGLIIAYIGMGGT